MRPPQAPRGSRGPVTPATAPTAPSAPSAADTTAASPSGATVVALRPRTVQSRNGPGATREATVNTPRRGGHGGSAGVDQRVAERAAATRRAVMHRIGLVAGAVAAALAVSWVALFSPVFVLDPALVVIDAPEGQVDIAAVQAVTGALAGTPLPRVDTRGVRAQLEDIPTVLTATLARDWPRGLVVTLMPRQAVAAVPVEGGFAVIDAQGVNIGTSGQAPAGVPVVGVTVGEDTTRTVTAVLNVLGALPADLRATVTSVSAATEDSVTFVLADGATVRWGADGENALKVSVLQTLRQLPARVYDVSTPRTPITE